MDGSALRNVFGSSASLAELSGDSVPQNEKKPGYTRFGLSEQRPAHQMHTKVRRMSVASISDKQPLSNRKRHHWYFYVPVLLVFGVVQSLFMHVHLPMAVDPTPRQRTELLIAGSLLVLFSGIAVPATDTNTELETPRSAGSAIDSGSNSDRGTTNWKTRLARSYGALLGLVYLTEKLPKDGVLAWVLIAPSLWYIGDQTLNGFLVALCISLAGSAATFYAFADLIRSGEQTTLVALAGTAAAYFGTSLVAGNVGRGLLNSH